MNTIPGCRIYGPLNRWARAAAAVLAMLLAAGLPAAQSPDPEPPARVLTLDEALRIAAEQNKDILKAREFRQKVYGRYVEERAAALPQVTISSSASRDSDESQKAFGGGFLEEFDFDVTRNLYTAEAGVTQAIYTWGQVGAAIRAAKEGMADADDQLRIYQQAVARDVTTAFQGVLLARELHALALENVAMKQRHLDEARRKFEAGLATDYDVLAAEVDLENARPAVIRAENVIDIACEQLRFLLGLEGQSVDAAGTLDAPVGAYPAYAPVLEIALQNRPEISELGHQANIARELIKIYGAGNKPRVDFRGGAGWRGQTIGEGQANGLAYSVGIYLTFPVYDGGRTQGKVIQARSDLATLTLEQAKLADSIALQVRQAVDGVREAGEIIRALGGTVTQAERLLAMAEKGFEFGVKTRLDVDDAQLNVLQAKINLSRARHDYLVARANLEWVTGTIATGAP
jgi:HAE1 family hydrophobic/amphiphilic exporter-1